MLNVFEGDIFVVSVALLGNIAVAFVINVVSIAVGRICVDFDSVMLVDKTTKMVKEERILWCKNAMPKNVTFSFLSG